MLYAVWATNKGCPTPESSQSNRHKTAAYCAELEERDTWIFLIILFFIYSNKLFLTKTFASKAPLNDKNHQFYVSPFLKNVEHSHLLSMDESAL